MVSILSKIKTNRARARFQTKLPQHSYQIAETASRMRIRTAKMNDVSWQDIAGKRSDLKLEIAKVLTSQNIAPKTGLIMIDKLSCNINESIELVDRYCYDGSLPYLDGHYEIKYREVTIFGFEHLGEQYDLKKNIVCRRKGDKRNKDEKLLGFYLRTKPFKPARLTNKIFAASFLGSGIATAALVYLSNKEAPLAELLKGTVAGFGLGSFAGMAGIALLSITYRHLRFPLDFLNFKKASTCSELSVLAKLIKSSNYYVRAAVAENQVIKDLIEDVKSRTDPEKLTWFAGSPFPCIRGTVAENIYTPTATLIELGEKDKFPLVTHAAAKNPKTPWETAANFLSKLERTTIKTTHYDGYEDTGSCDGGFGIMHIYKTTEDSFYPEKTIDLVHEVLEIHHLHQVEILHKLAELNPDLHEAATT